MRLHFKMVSGNPKTGPIPVTMSDQNSCPTNCGLKGNGCYAELHTTGLHWRNLTTGKTGGSIVETLPMLHTIPRGALWRHNAAGDLFHVGQKIAADVLAYIVDVNAKRKARGFTYTHHLVLGESDTAKHNRQQVKLANNKGFTVNLSADNLTMADQLMDLGIGPVVTIMPEDSKKIEYTPRGHAIVKCPATYIESMTCMQCQLCANQDRKSIVGFPVHGARKAKANRVFMMQQI